METSTNKHHRAGGWVQNPHRCGHCINTPTLALNTLNNTNAAVRAINYLCKAPIRTMDSPIPSCNFPAAIRAAAKQCHPMARKESQQAE